VESEDRRLAERNRTRHYSQYGTIEPVAIYEEQEPMSEAEKKRVLDEIYARAVKDGIIKPVVDILVEEDVERFIKLDSTEKGG
jgi:hypothetical protein